MTQTPLLLKYRAVASFPPRQQRDIKNERHLLEEFEISDDDLDEYVHNLMSAFFLENLSISVSIANVPCLKLKFSENTQITDWDLWRCSDHSINATDKIRYQEFRQSVSDQIRQLLLDYEREVFTYRELEL